MNVKKGKTKTEELVDRFGALSDEIKRLSAERDKIKEQLISLGEGTYMGANYNVTVSKAVSYELDTEKIYQRLGKEKFLEVAKVSVEKLRNYIAEVELQKYITEVRESYRLNYKKI